MCQLYGFLLNDYFFTRNSERIAGDKGQHGFNIILFVPLMGNKNSPLFFV